MSQSISPVYHEKKWGKDVEGEHVTDGYVFRGKLRFKKALEGLRGVIIKGVSGGYRGVKFDVKDVRKKGVGVEAEVEIETKKHGERGIAILEMLGPNNKKEYVVMITKSKSSEAKFVNLLTEEIIKPMMNDFIMDKDVNDIIESELKPRGMSTKQNSTKKCGQCDRTFKTNQGLKTHITKIHRAEKGENKVKEELKEQENSLKIYKKKCEKCEFTAEASKRYTIAQIIINHKKECNKSVRKSTTRDKCSKCDFEAKEIMVMRRHLRDVHEAGTVSLSPPLKKKRKMSDEEEEIKTMEIDDVEDDAIENLSFKMDDMEIEVEAEIEQKSELKDEKILLQREELERQETLFKIKQFEIDKKKILDEEKRINSQKEMNRKRKQKSKDERKRKNAKNRKINQNDILHESSEKLKNIPEECKNLVDKDDIVYVVPGDGSCAPNCAAALLFQDEKFGPQLRRKMNLFMAKNWFRKYQYITPCSSETPFVKQIKGKTISFTDPKKVIDFLKTSSEAAFMWSNSEDLAVLADMYQIRIKVITINRDDQKPTVNWIYPDDDLKDVAELKNVEMNDLVLLHEDETHYNLIISKNSDLALLGSISSRLVEEESTKDKTYDDVEKQQKHYKETTEK